MLGAKLRENVHAFGLEKTIQWLGRGIRESKITPNQISLRNLAEGMLGHNWHSKMSRFAENRLRESSEAVDASSFSAITGQILIDKVLEGYNMAEFIGDQLVTVMPVTNGNLGTQKVPWLSDVLDDPSVLQQGQEYPRTTFTSNYVTLPAPEKRGEICAITAEMIFSDLTKQAMNRGESVGRRTRLRREERILDVVLGVAASAYQYTWNGTGYSTYLTSGNWVNKITGQTFTDWTNLQNVENLAAVMLDPNTGKAIDIPTGEMKLLVMPQRVYQVKHTLHATNVRSGTPGAAFAGNVTEAPNPVETQYPILTSKHAYQRLLASGLTAAQSYEYWYLGAFQRAFAYREVWPMEAFNAPVDAPANFFQDIMVQVKAREYGVAGVMDPRYVFQSTNT